jgi:hypothetical protein
MTKKEVIKSLMNRYGRKFITVNEDLKSQFIGTASNIELKEDIIYSLEFNDTLGIKDTLTKDNINLYYEFMSDRELIKQKSIEYYLTCVMTDRRLKVLDLLEIDLSSIALGDNKKISYLESRKNWIIGQVIFGVKDTLKSIEEYIKEIKETDSYKAYIANKS